MLVGDGPLGFWYVFSGVGGCGAGFGAHFWGRRRGDVLLGWWAVLVKCPFFRMEGGHWGMEQSGVRGLTD